MNYILLLSSVLGYYYFFSKVDHCTVEKQNENYRYSANGKAQNVFGF